MMELRHNQWLSICYIFLLFLIGIYSALATNLYIYGFNIGIFIAVGMLIGVPIFIGVLYKGFTFVLSLLLLMSISFNVEVPLWSQGEVGFSADHPNGLRAALVINQFYILIAMWFYML
ncbi:hypothetical protein [Halobacillus sp. BAB-2008]|uniref:hypothetical protein n=1 Tax=Halobacillus sp. BAB-2008 TaxID=1246484 RepID=UPI0002A4E33B|nr:hypothetical protein [Halobacillus sp. BAB-2008]ELK44323.1 hypothetical protein D479_19658 [Halobacillus sp. BAB-2008]